MSARNRNCAVGMDNPNNKKTFFGQMVHGFFSETKMDKDGKTIHIEKT